MTRKISIPNLDHFLKRYIEGESENSLSKEIGVSRTTFRRRLLENGIEPRGQSAAEKAKWDRMTASERKAQVTAAHNAVRGRKIGFDELCRRAQSHEGSLTYNVSDDEILFGEWLRDYGFDITHNLAVGPYNCDIGSGPVTVEIWGGGWHPKDGEVERTKYILDAGYSMLIIDLDQRRFPLTEACLPYFVSLYNVASRDPSPISKYWMIRGDGEIVFRRTNSDNITLEKPFTSGRNPTNGRYKRVPR